jgi:type IV pilus assembly protein PilM
VFGLFNNKNNSYIGVDISSTSVKVLELSKSGSGYRVEAYAVEPLPENAVVEKNIKELDGVRVTVEKAIQKCRSKVKQAVVAVPGSSVITKVLDMDAELKEDEIEERLQIEGEQYIPFPMEEVTMDFALLGPSPTQESQQQVLLAAGKRELVEDRESSLNDAGLDCRVVDVETYAMLRAMPLLEDQIESDAINDQVIAIMDIGHSMTTMTVVHEGRIVHYKEQVFGGKQLTEEIMRRYGQTLAEAGRMKKQGGLPDDYVPEVLEPFKESVIQQVSRSLQFFYASTEYNDVDVVFLAGGSSAIPGLSQLVTEKLGTQALIANPFINMSLSGKVNASALSNDAPSLLIACGLAMRSFS